MQYRPDIDGLRAVAVIPVILFHAGLEHWQGGFVGVDIFFVISGYLITSILLRENEAGRFSVLKFYERRARRILPALIVMVLACIPFALITMVPSQFTDFSQSIAATSLFSSNILFAFESGYFSGAAEEKPLLHTWSLAVEEQFYILFPLFLLFFWNKGRKWLLTTIIVVSLLSLIAAEIGWRVVPNANFYLLQGRIWELLAGSICAFVLSGDGRKPTGSGPLALLGLALIVISIIWLDSSTPFPSLYALLPVVGTALVILYSMPGTLAFRLLSFRLFVGIGLISYSAYLWHQPLFAFARIHLIHEPSVHLMLILSVVAMGIAYLSWRFVETPFRKKPGPWFPSMKEMLTAASVWSLALLGLGVIGNSVGGGMVRLANYVDLEARVGFDDQCLFGANGRMMINLENSECSNGVASEHSIAIWGDSIANSLSYGLRTSLAERDIQFRQYSHSNCHPIIGIVRTDNALSRNCETFNKAILAHLLASDVDLVILSARWPTLYLNETPPSAFSKKPPSKARISAASYADGNRSHQKKMARALADTVLQLRQNEIDVVVFGVVPEAGWHVPMKLYRARSAGLDSSELMITPRATIDAYVPQVDHWLRSSVAEQADFIGLSEHLCDPSGCAQLEADEALYSDELHPSFYLSETLAREVSPLLGAYLTDPAE
ncbi:MAG: acyltransferase family protein [Pseudomonadota bacterium]